MKALELGKEYPSVIAMGADGISAPCLLMGKKAFLGDAAGDLEFIEHLNSFRRSVAALLDMQKPKIEAVAIDLHPDYISAKEGVLLASQVGARLFRVQHHEAHVAAAAAEYGLSDYAGIACDGMGYGRDDTLWGGEIFDVSGKTFKRIGSLEEHVQLGGDFAVDDPLKMLYGVLHTFMEPSRVGLYDQEEERIYKAQLEQRFNIFTTTSAGRMLDAAAALLGFSCGKGAAIVLERHARGAEPYPLEPVIEEKGRFVLLTVPLFRFIVDNLRRDRRRLAATVHHYLAKGMFQIAHTSRKSMVFSGGVAANSIITGLLAKRGVLMHKQMPPGDAGISLGQAVIAGSSCRDHIPKKDDTKIPT